MLDTLSQYSGATVGDIGDFGMDVVGFEVYLSPLFRENQLAGKGGDDRGNFDGLQGGLHRDPVIGLDFEGDITLLS
jgi:hypothetical protein